MMTADQQPMAKASIFGNVLTFFSPFNWLLREKKEQSIDEKKEEVSKRRLKINFLLLFFF